MAILAFQKPDKVVMLENDSKYGKFEFRPLETGFGTTVGNALRRILLSSLEGFAICAIKIDGVEHEFASVPGVKEDVTNIILKLKQVRFKQLVEEFETEKASITISNSTEFKAGDIGKQLSGFEVLNPELVICHLDSKATMTIEVTINKGRGYVPADENREFCTDVNVIPIDSIYTPIRNVKYVIEPFRVEQKTDYDKLVLEVSTDGSIHPKDALKEAAKILIYHFMLFSDEKITVDDAPDADNEEFLRSDPNIHFVGYQNDVRPFLVAADVLVFPSYREGFPNVVLQAGAMSVPAIVTNINGCNEIIKEDFNGKIF